MIDQIKNFIQKDINIVFNRSSFKQSRKILYNTDNKPKNLSIFYDKLKLIFNFSNPFIRKFKSCAIVGNSGILLRKQYGQLVDNHECIVRFNYAPTKEFEKHVGSKTNYRIMGRNWIFREFNNEIIIHRYNKPTYAKIDIDTALINSYKMYNVYAFDTDFINEARNLLLNYTNTTGTVSSGYLGVLFGLKIAEKVSIFGFNMPINRQFQYHYYDQQLYEEFKNHHPFAKEMEVYLDLQKYNLIKIY